MHQTDDFQSLTYVGKEPNIQALNKAYDQTTNELESYFDQCRNNYDDRRNFRPSDRDWETSVWCI